VNLGAACFYYGACVRQRQTVQQGWPTDRVTTSAVGAHLHHASQRRHCRRGASDAPSTQIL